MTRAQVTQVACLAALLVSSTACKGTSIAKKAEDSSAAHVSITDGDPHCHTSNGIDVSTVTRLLYLTTRDCLSCEDVGRSLRESSLVRRGTVGVIVAQQDSADVCDYLAREHLRIATVISTHPLLPDRRAALYVRGDGDSTRFKLLREQSARELLALLR